ncbi:MAG: protoheme IX farnesyltransferase [Pseudomonadota bacterium]
MADQNENPAPEQKPQARSMAPEMAEAREGVPTGEHHTPSAAEVKARGRRNIAIAAAVAGFALLIYLTTFFRLMENLQAAGGAS